MEALGDYSAESKLEGIFDKIRPNLDIEGPYLPECCGRAVCP